MKQKIICPTHEEEMREEWVDGMHTAFCLKCPKRYEICAETYYMEGCVKLKNHTGLHLSRWSGTEFSSDYLIQKSTHRPQLLQNKNANISQPKFLIFEGIGPLTINPRGLIKS